MSCSPSDAVERRRQSALYYAHALTHARMLKYIRSYARAHERARWGNAQQHDTQHTRPHRPPSLPPATYFVLHARPGRASAPPITIPCLHFLAVIERRLAAQTTEMTQFTASALGISITLFEAHACSPLAFMVRVHINIMRARASDQYIFCIKLMCHLCHRLHGESNIMMLLQEQLFVNKRTLLALLHAHTHTHTPRGKGNRLCSRHTHRENWTQSQSSISNAQKAAAG